MKLPLHPALRLSRRALCAAAVTGVLLPTAALAATLRISVAVFPNSEITPSIVDGLKLAATKTPGTEVTVVTAPMARSVAAMIDGSVDMHLPLLRPPHPEGLPFMATEARMFEVPFVLYSNNDKPVDLVALHENGKYKIETEVAHVGYFDFGVVGSAGLEASLRKVNAGRIDGFIFAGNTMDPILEALGLKNIHRTFYRNFDAVGAVRKDAQGAVADRWFTAAMAATRTDPAFIAIQQKILSSYRGPDWQQA